MACQQLTAEDARQSMAAHLEHKGHEIFAQYGPQLTWTSLQQLLNDRNYVRYPCEVVFDAASLEPGEFAYPLAKGDRPDAGYTIQVHPFYLTHLDKIPHLILYQLVIVNYGDFATAEDAEIFGSAALGISQEEYYQTLCNLADELN